MATTKTKITPAQFRRILDIVKTVNANPAKIKTAFLAATGEDIRTAGWTVDEIREQLSTAADDGDDEAQEKPQPRSRRAAAPAPVEEEPELEDEDDPAEDEDDNFEDDEDEPDITPAKARQRTPAQIAATERMRQANAAKANGNGAKPKGGKAKTERAPARVVVEVDPKKLLKQLKAEDPDRWDKVIEITEVSDKGRALRVKIRCKVPTTGNPAQDEYGKETREIAVQDMFQVHYTTEGAKKARSLLRTARRAEDRPAAPARSERKTGTGGQSRAAASTGTVKGNKPAATTRRTARR